MNSLLVETARKDYADSLFESVRRCYNEANKDYLQKQIEIASEYLTDDQKDKLRQMGLRTLAGVDRYAETSGEDTVNGRNGKH